MKLSRPAAVFAAVVILVGGAAVAVNATTGTDPVTLCASTKSGAVTVPDGNGDCAKGTTAFSVASDAAVQALASRLGTTETGLSAAETRLAAAETDLSAAETRLAAAEAELADQAAALAALDHDFREFTPSTLEVEGPTRFGDIQWTVRAVGVGLKPGADVRLHSRLGQFPPSSSVIASVAADGTVSVSSTLMCNQHSVFFSTLTDGGDPISTDVIASGC